MLRANMKAEPFPPQTDVPPLPRTMIGPVSFNLLVDYAEYASLKYCGLPAGWGLQ